MCAWIYFFQELRTQYPIKPDPALLQVALTNHECVLSLHLDMSCVFLLIFIVNHGETVERIGSVCGYKAIVESLILADSIVTRSK